MKRSITCFALFTCLGFAMYAAPQEQAPAPSVQSQGRRQFNPDRQARAMAKRLNLTAEQQQQLLPILTDRDQQMQSIRNDSSLSLKDRHARMASLREDSRNRINALLTPDQKAAYDQMLQQAREHRREEKSQGGGNS